MPNTLRRLRRSAGAPLRRSRIAPRSRAQWPSRCRPKPASLKKVRCAPASLRLTMLCGWLSIRPTASSSLLSSCAVKTVCRSSASARSSIASSGSRPVAAAMSAMLRCSSARARGCADLDDVHLVPLAVEEAKRRRRRQLGAHAVAERPVGEHRASAPRRAAPSAGFQLASPSTGYGDASVKSIVSGQHETWPSRRWPRALAAAIASRSSNTALRVGAVVQQRRDHHRPAARARPAIRGTAPACAPPLVSM